MIVQFNNYITQSLVAFVFYYCQNSHIINILVKIQTASYFSSTSTFILQKN